MTYPPNGEDIKDFLDLARREGCLIIWTHLAFRPGGKTEGNRAHNNNMSCWKGQFQGCVSHRIMDDWILPINHQDDVVLLTCRNNAFVGIDLDLLLRAQKRDE